MARTTYKITIEWSTEDNTPESGLSNQFVSESAWVNGKDSRPFLECLAISFGYALKAVEASGSTVGTNGDCNPAEAFADVFLD